MKIFKIIAIFSITLFTLAILTVLGTWYWFEFTVANTLDRKFYGHDSYYISKALQASYGVAEYSPRIEEPLNKEEIQEDACKLLGKSLTLKECILPLSVSSDSLIAKTRPLQLPLIRRTPPIVWFHEFVLENNRYKNVLYKVLNNPCNYFNSLHYSVNKPAQGSFNNWENYRCSKRDGVEIEVHFVDNAGNLKKKELINIDFTNNYKRKQSYYGSTSQDDVTKNHILSYYNSYIWYLEQMLAVGVAFQGEDDFPPEMRVDGCKVMEKNFPISDCIMPRFRTLDKPKKCSERVNSPCISLTAHEYLKKHPMMKEYKQAVLNPCEYAKKINRKNMLKLCQNTPNIVKPVHVIFDFIDETGHVVDSMYIQ